MNDVKPNRLINEKSPYLLQHARNPVDWYPWCDEAFIKAKEENKPIFLSIGYSTCHWCHVMEHESFEDKEVADLMNEVFISIKVDREERPDIDHVYMTTCQTLTGSGGWPLSIIMTPDKKPFFAGTYFPKESRYGRIGFIDLINNIQSAWKEKRNEIEESAGQITDYLKQTYSNTTQTELSEEIIKRAYEHFKNNFDKVYGGFGNAPKFPSPHNLMFLLRYWKSYKEPEALEMVVKTLTELKMGGIYDHIGFGFHRYSTDRKWLVPHFEKMLYDQAMLIIAFTETYQATGNDGFKRTAEEIIEYVLRDMTSPDGGFYSAEDADSEGEEGKFYIWTKEELIKILGDNDYRLYSEIYNVKDEGNYNDESSKQLTGKNILHLTEPIEVTAGRLNIESTEILDKLAEIRIKLFEKRRERIHPLKDDKILADWNGLIIAALSKAGRTFNNNKYIEAAEKSYIFIKKNMFDNNGYLFHRYRNGESKIKATLNDYAFLIWGLIELYQSTFENEYIKTATDLADITIKYFWDTKNNGFYFTNDTDEELIVKTKEYYDSAIPSGNSVMLQNLVMLSRISSEIKYEEYAHKLINSYSESVVNAPHGFSFFLNSFMYLTGENFEIIIAGDKNDYEPLNALEILNKKFIPNKVVVIHDTSQNPIFDYLKNYDFKNGRTAIYVCKNYNCSLPSFNINDALKVIEE